MTHLLSFPSSEMIQKYLENKHPNTKNDDYLKNKKILETAASILGGQKKDIQALHVDIILILQLVQDNRSEPIKTLTTMNLFKALCDCAKFSV